MTCHLIDQGFEDDNFEPPPSWLNCYCYLDVYCLTVVWILHLKKKGIGKDWPKKINKLSIPCSRLRQADINLLEREDARRLHWAPVLIGSDLRSYPHPMSLDPGTSDVSLLAMETALSPSSPRWMTTAWTSWTRIVQLGGDSLSSRGSEADRVMCSSWAMFWFWLMFGCLWSFLVS